MPFGTNDGLPFFYITVQQIVRLIGNIKVIRKNVRKETIERVFADAKEKHAMRYTQYRGLAKVKAEATPPLCVYEFKKACETESDKRAFWTIYLWLYSNIGSSNTKVGCKSNVATDFCLQSGLPPRGSCQRKLTEGVTLSEGVICSFKNRTVLILI